jgi:hypothetical protein
MNLFEKLYEECLLNIPCNFSVNFTKRVINNLEEYRMNMTPRSYAISVQYIRPLAADL